VGAQQGVTGVVDGDVEPLRRGAQVDMLGGDESVQGVEIDVVGVPAGQGESGDAGGGWGPGQWFVDAGVVQQLGAVVVQGLRSGVLRA
jgi:hypothetical protein